jgi:CHAT domain-containing protein
MLPSAWSALAVAQAPVLTSARESSVLVVGDAPGPSGIPALPGARRELAVVAAEYRRSRILSGQAATPTAFAQAAPLAEIVHFAGHAQADFRSPWSAFLQLNSDAAHPEGRVRIEDLERWRLPLTRLVVLSGCETSLGRVFRGQGMVNLARPFLGAGAKAVLGTLWKVDDETARLIMSEFHRLFASGLDAPSSLRRAQAAMLNSADPTHAAAKSWSGFVLVEAR